MEVGKVTHQINIAARLQVQVQSGKTLLNKFLQTLVRLVPLAHVEESSRVITGNHEVFHMPIKSATLYT